MDLFGDLGLSQLVKDPTHNGSKILDLLLTNTTQSISNLTVHDNGYLCKSDHYPISFEIYARVKHKKESKRKVYNFKRANWEDLNHDLTSINWDTLLNNSDIEISWSKFLNVFRSTCDKHIPTVTAKTGFQPPWFDSDVYSQCREKDKWRSKYNKSKSGNHYIKYIYLLDLTLKSL